VEQLLHGGPIAAARGPGKHAPPVTQHEIMLLVERVGAAAAQRLRLADDSMVLSGQQQLLPVIRPMLPEGRPG
jgi:hypothetical protein